jgi:hypothetical protein
LAPSKHSCDFIQVTVLILAGLLPIGVDDQIQTLVTMYVVIYFEYLSQIFLEYSIHSFIHFDQMCIITYDLSILKSRTTMDNEVYI